MLSLIPGGAPFALAYEIALEGILEVSAALRSCSYVDTRAYPISSAFMREASPRTSSLATGSVYVTSR